MKDQINLRVHPDMKNEIDARAQKVGVPRNVWMERALRWALDQPPTERAKKERV